MAHYLQEELYKHIKEKADLFDFIQSSALDGLWYWDLEHPENEWMNDRFWEVLGYDPDLKQYLSSEWQTIIDQDDLALALENFNNHVENPDCPYDQVVRYQHRNGSTVWIRCRGIVIRNKNNDPVRMLGAHTDITELKKSEERLINRNQFLSLILDSSEDLIFVKDDQYRIIQANKAFIDVYPEDQRDKIIGYTTVESYDEKDAEVFLEQDKIAFDKGYSQVLEHVEMPNEKTKRALETRKIRFEDREGQKYILGIARDVTTQQQLIDELNAKNSALEQAKRDMDNLLRTSDLCAVFVDESLRIMMLTPGAKQVLQAENDYYQKPIHYYLSTFLSPVIIEDLEKAVEQTLSTEKEIISELGIHYHVKVRPYFLENGKSSGAVLSITDIDVVKKSELLVRDSQTLLELAAKNANIGIWKWSIQQNEYEWNDGMFHLYAVDRSTVTDIGNVFYQYIVEADLPRVKHAIEKACRNHISVNVEYQIKNEYGHTRYLHLIAQYLPESRGVKPQLTGMCFDITKLKEAEATLSKIALEDSVTGISNRTHLLAYLPRALARAERNGTSLAVLYLDLDDFKQVNDTLGHSRGDELLLQVANRIGEALRAEDFFARIGGDEFAIILEGIQAYEEISAVAERCLGAIEDEFDLEGNVILQSFSLGISIYPDSAKTPEGLLQYADLAMYKAKEKGKNNFVFFRDELDQKMQRLTRIEKALITAVEEDQFKLLYQPQFNSEGEITGAEALLRWHHPDLPSISPDEFIPIAERKHIIHEIGEWVIEQVARDSKQLGLLNKDSSFRIAINISSMQLMTHGFVDHLIAILARYEVSPTSITVEITETALIRNIEKAVSILYQLGKYGVRIALDDFGKGYSSLNYLVNLPIDYLKIDKSFTDKISEMKSNLMIESIVSLADRLGIHCVAEGVEEIEQFQFLKKISCHLYQGYYFSKPVEINELLTLAKVGLMK